ncbi:MAG: 50S ribosomal protein L3 [Candidatus Nanoarchaeia archaeon]|jgi:large subunit ribosomal protein L3|nr:50S ribosomal protein L3 [Candidatus Nanoarchaeia archaeon]|tara:strand:- start:20179 stop:21132 length:954 start_codon:yes stop_codon:yes gene_type:complete
MPNKKSPRKGSLQFWPRKRAKRSYASIRSWPKLNDTKLMGFAGYKAGMTHIILKDNSNATTKDELISQPVTIIECPPLKPLSLRFYQNTVKGPRCVSELFAKNLDKELIRKIKTPKKSNESKDYNDIRLVVYTQPKLTNIGKKKPEIFELEISGDKEKKLGFAKSLLDKEIKINDVFKEGQFLDAHGITKGKGFQGTVKRFGVHIRQHKSEKVKRGVGSLGPWTPKRVSFRVPMPGKMGYHKRTDYNKWLVKIGDKVEEINPKGGLLQYGLVKNNYVLLKGSIPGSRKRLIILTEPLRSKKESQQVEIDYISLESKQ